MLSSGGEGAVCCSRQPLITDKIYFKKNLRQTPNDA